MKSISLLPTLARSFNKWCFLLLLLWAAPSVSLAQSSSICVIEQGAGGEFCDNDSDTMAFPNPFYVRIFLHIIRDSLGQGGQSPAQVEEALTFLDKAFNPHGIFFVRDCESVFVDQQPCFNAPSFSTPGMPHCADPSLFIPGGINLFLFPDRLTNAQLDGGIAFGIPSSGLALFGLIDTTTNNTSMVRSFVLAHEVGHCLGLYHTHAGTGETLGGAGFCNVSSECADGSNCGSAGDYVCDTPADPKLQTSTHPNVAPPTCQWTLSGTDNCNGTP
ncbi:MAG: hypothetical protein KIS77_07535 [Saprospiraceae bacterium]|nr:hypothetical protein [Saprospiraceae bacterium]